MRMTRFAPATLLIFALASGPVWAQGLSDEGSLAVSLGVFNFSKTPTSLEGGIEIAGAPRAYDLAPVFGIAGTEDGSFWGYGGLRRDFQVGRRGYVAPGFGIALYEEGDGKDLGGVVEFRSSLEIGMDVGSRSRAGLLVYHLSNAGFYDLNPGANSAVLIWRWYPP